MIYSCFETILWNHNFFFKLNQFCFYKHKLLILIKFNLVWDKIKKCGLLSKDWIQYCRIGSYKFVLYFVFHPSNLVLYTKLSKYKKNTNWKKKDFL